MAKATKVKRTSFARPEVRKSVTIKKRADNERQPNSRRHKTVAAPKLRASITPGSVLILLAGPYKGKRVVCLKQLESGNLMVTGPYQINGIPLRRVNQRYVIATSTKLPLDGVDVSKFDDTFFNKNKKAKQNKGEKENVFMSQGDSEARVIPEEKKAAQHEVDNALLKFLSKNENALLRQYLKTRFTLRDRMYPHALKF